MRAYGRAAVFALVVATVSCERPVEPQVIVTIDAEADARARGTWLRVVVTNNEDEEAWQRVYELGAGEVLPFSIPPITARDGDAQRRFTVTSELFDTVDAPGESAQPFSRLVTTSRYIDGSVAHALLTHTDACNDFGAACAPGQTCFRGDCVGACIEPTVTADISTTPTCSSCEVCGDGVVCQAQPRGTECGCAGDTCDGTGQCAVTRIVQIISAGGAHTCVVTNEFDLYCWGNNEDGQIGVDGYTSDQGVTLAREDVRSVSAAADYTCAIDTDGDLRCWGESEDGRLGRDTPGEVTLSAADEVAADRSHACARSRDELTCWGRCTRGQIGQGATGNGCSADGLDEEPPSLVEGVSGAQQVCVGWVHSCALDGAGRVLCWGSNENGEAGDLSGGAPYSIPTLVDIDVVDPELVEITCGGFSVCVRNRLGHTWCWGGASEGQLGTGELIDERVGRVGATDDLRFRSIDCGRSHCCGIEEDTLALHCWGQNTSRQIGDNGSSGAIVSTPVVVAEGTQWSVIELGDEHSCGVQTNGSFWCWGQNENRQVGVGFSETVNVPLRLCLPEA